MGPGYSIVRQDLKVMYMVNTAQKSYLEMPFQGATDVTHPLQGDEKLPGEVSRKELGREVVDGHPCLKYAITFQHGGRTSVVHHWMAQDIKFPVKVAAADGSWGVEYKNISLGPQPDSLFEVPAGFQKVAMPAMGAGAMPGMGVGGMGGMPPGQGPRPGQGMPPAPAKQ